MKCMGDFGEGYLVDAGEDSFEQEMGIKFKRPKFKAPKIKVPKIISKPIQAITKPVTSIASSVVRNPIAAVTTGVGVALAPAAIAVSAVPGVNKIAAPVTDTIKAAAAPVTQVVAPIATMPLAMVSPKLAEQAVNLTMPTQPKMPTMVEEVSEEAPVLDTAPAAILTSDSTPATPINSQGQAVLDTTPATLVSSSSKKEEKKGNTGAIIGGLAVAGIAAYMFMKE